MENVVRGWVTHVVYRDIVCAEDAIKHELHAFQTMH